MMKNSFFHLVALSNEDQFGFFNRQGRHDHSMNEWHPFQSVRLLSGFFIHGSLLVKTRV